MSKHIVPDRVLSYLAKEWSLFDLFNHPNKIICDDSACRYQNYIDHILKEKEETLYEFVNIGSDDLTPLMYFRSLNKDELRDLLVDNEENIKNPNIIPKYRYGDVLGVTLPNGEVVLFSLSDTIYTDDVSGMTIGGRYTTLKDETPENPPYEYVGIRYVGENISVASAEEQKYMSLLQFFWRNEREYGEFKPGDLFYDKDTDERFLYRCNDSGKIIDKLLTGKITILATEETLDYEFPTNNDLLS